MMILDSGLLFWATLYTYLTHIAAFLITRSKWRHESGHA